VEANSAILASDEDVALYAGVDYLFNLKDYPSVYPIDETSVLQAWFHYRNEPEAGYDKIIDRATFFSRHGLTPAYYTNATGTMFLVTSQEHIDKKLH
jgi:hypothetical protein